MPAFDRTEYQRRVAGVAGVMQNREIDTLVVLSEANICYLTGYEGFSDYVPQAAMLDSFSLVRALRRFVRQLLLPRAAKRDENPSGRDRSPTEV